MGELSKRCLFRLRSIRQTRAIGTPLRISVPAFSGSRRTAFRQFNCWVRSSLKQDDVDGAASLLRQAHALRSTDVSVLSNLGLVELRLGARAKAIELLTRATQLSPQSASAWMNLGTAHYSGKQLCRCDSSLPTRGEALTELLLRTCVTLGSPCTSAVC